MNSSPIQSPMPVALTMRDVMDMAKKKKPTRVSRACQNCRKRKQGCDEQRPCKRCLDKGIKCIEAQDTTKITKKKKPLQLPRFGTAPAGLVENHLRAHGGHRRNSSASSASPNTVSSIDFHSSLSPQVDHRHSSTHSIDSYSYSGSEHSTVITSSYNDPSTHSCSSLVINEEQESTPSYQSGFDNNYNYNYHAISHRHSSSGGNNNNNNNHNSLIHDPTDPNAEPPKFANFSEIGFNSLDGPVVFNHTEDTLSTTSGGDMMEEEQITMNLCNDKFENLSVNSRKSLLEKYESCLELNNIAILLPLLSCFPSYYFLPPSHDESNKEDLFPSDHTYGRDFPFFTQPSETGEQYQLPHLPLFNMTLQHANPTDSTSFGNSMDISLPDLSSQLQLSWNNFLGKCNRDEYLMREFSHIKEQWTEIVSALRNQMDPNGLQSRLSSIDHSSDSMPIGALFWGHSCGIQHANSSLCKTLHVNLDSLIGRSALDIFPKEEHDKIHQALMAIQQKRSISYLRTRIVNHTSSLGPDPITQVSVTSLRDPLGAAVGMFVFYFYLDDPLFNG